VVGRSRCYDNTLWRAMGEQVKYEDACYLRAYSEGWEAEISFGPDSWRCLRHVRPTSLLGGAKTPK